MKHIHIQTFCHFIEIEAIIAKLELLAFPIKVINWLETGGL